MQVAETMNRDIHLISPEVSLAEAAKMMADYDCGSLPVGDGDRLVGMLTDRDIVVRGLAQGKDLQGPVRDVMSTEVKYCFEDEDIDHVAQNMGDLQVRRLPVLNREKRLTGIVSLADIARSEHSRKAGEALSDIAQPTGKP